MNWRISATSELQCSRIYNIKRCRTVQPVIIMHTEHTIWDVEISILTIFGGIMLAWLLIWPGLRIMLKTVIREALAERTATLEAAKDLAKQIDEEITP